MRFATVNQMFGDSSSFRARGNHIVECSSDNETVLGSSRKLGGAAEHLIDGSEKRICRLSSEFYSPHIIEKRSNAYLCAVAPEKIWSRQVNSRYIADEDDHELTQVQFTIGK